MAKLSLSSDDDKTVRNPKAKGKLSLPPEDNLSAASQKISEFKTINSKDKDAQDVIPHIKYLKGVVDNHKVALDSALAYKYRGTPDEKNKFLSPEEGEAATFKHSGKRGGYEEFVNHANTLADYHSKKKGYEERRPKMEVGISTFGNSNSGGGYRMDKSANYDTTLQNILSPEPESEKSSVLVIPRKKK